MPLGRGRYLRDTRRTPLLPPALWNSLVNGVKTRPPSSGPGVRCRWRTTLRSVCPSGVLLPYLPAVRHLTWADRKAEWRRVNLDLRQVSVEVGDPRAVLKFIPYSRTISERRILYH